MSILVIAEHDNHHLKPVTLSILSAASKLGSQIDVLVAGKGCVQVAEDVQVIEHVTRVLLADAPEYEHQLAENMAELVCFLAKQYRFILAPATTFGKNLLPRVAAKLDVSMISEVTEILSEDTFVRPIYAGNAFATVRSLEEQKLLTIRGTSFAPLKPILNPVPVEKINFVRETGLSFFVANELARSERPELTAAKIVVSGGRGLQSAENFHLLETLADELNAAVGASRAAVDAGFVPNDYQVGQTGKVVAPDLYFAIGISGAIQHLAGMKGSKVIVAINQDPEAPIFKVADYGLVGDLFKILPELTLKLKSPP